MSVSDILLYNVLTVARFEKINMIRCVWGLAWREEKLSKFWDSGPNRRAHLADQQDALANETGLPEWNMLPL